MEEIIVPTGYKRVEESDSILRSGGVGPCVVLGGVYDKKIAYMIHDIDSCFRNLFGEMVNDLEKDVDDKSKLDLFLGGLERIRERNYEEMSLIRDDVKREIYESSYADRIVKVQWCKPLYMLELHLVTNEGRGYFEEEMIDY